MEMTLLQIAFCLLYSIIALSIGCFGLIWSYEKIGSDSFKKDILYCCIIILSILIGGSGILFAAFTMVSISIYFGNLIGLQ